LNGGSKLRRSLLFDSDGGMALLCVGRNGSTSALAMLGVHCVRATRGSEDPLRDGATRGATRGVGWQSPNEFVDLSFGLSWIDLESRPTALLASGPTLGRDLLPQLGFELDTLGAWAHRLEGQNLRIDSLINLGPQARMLIGGDVGRSRVTALDGTQPQWESAALSFGLGFGQFSGELTGRLVELPRNGQQWSALDIGVSWRTPWRGELSVGARNVLGSGDRSRWPLADLPPSEDPSARVPYVRYQQDL
jgi:hypothetical protein